MAEDEKRREELGTASQLRLEGIRGTNRGEPIERLFRKLAESLALSDDDKEYYNQIVENLKTVYGFSNIEEEPSMEEQKKEFEERLQVLRAQFALDEQTETRDVLNRMNMTIREHEFAIADLERKMQLAGKSVATA